MYGTWLNQLYHLLHYFLALAVVYFWLPKILFEPVQGNPFDRFIGNFLRMIMFVVVVSYILVITKLMEFLGFAAITITWVMFRRYVRLGRVSTTSGVGMAIVYDVLEGPRVIQVYLERLINALRTGVSSVAHRKWDAPSPLLLIVLVEIILFGWSVFIRFYDSLKNPAPSMSDGYVTLAWLKYVNERFLFHDGIYPQGLYFFMDTLLKLSFINPLYVLKYTGPVDTCLILLGLYYVVNRLSESRAGGIVAAGLYGLFGMNLVFYDWARQAATNSQEFGFALIMPTLLFVYRYFEGRQRVDLVVAFSGLCAIGFTHPVAYLLVVIGVISLVLAQLILQPTESWLPCMWVAAAGGISAVVIVSPLVMGYVLGRSINSSAQAYSTSTVSGTVSVPTLYPLDYTALVAILVLLVYAVIARMRGEFKVVWMFGAVFGLFMFGLYYLSGPVTHSTVLISRQLDIWGITEAFVIGMAVAALVKPLERSARGLWIEGICLVALVGVSLSLFAPPPIIPYKMQWDDGVQAYLNIDGKYRFTSYMIVAPNEEYSLVLGDGYRMDWGQFVQDYNPLAPPLTKYGQNSIDLNLATDIFVYVPNQLFEVSKSNAVYPLEAPIYAQEKKQLASLKQWLKQYQQQHGKLDVYYNGAHLVVYHIHMVRKDTTSTKASA